MSAPADALLHSFANPGTTAYRIHIDIPEFTCLCPLSGQPDFAQLLLDYVPDQRCVELKSLKMYVWSFRDQGVFHEAVTHQISRDLVALLAPQYLRLEARFGVRGGIWTTVVVEHPELPDAALRDKCLMPVDTLR